LLPNPVDYHDRILESPNETREHIMNILGLDPEKLIVTYPVRVIRRKNIGEFILLATLFANQANWVVTQPPNNPVEQPDYNKWVAFCSDQNIPVTFEAGHKVDFISLVKHSSFCVTTSVREGFGMVYLEPWLLGTPVIGRNIPMVTSDFVAAGMKFNMLYSELLINFNNRPTDFKALNQDEQMEFIQHINRRTAAKEILFNENPFLHQFLTVPDRELIKFNRDVVQTNYSISRFAERLSGLYKRFAH
jgi:glycosyltransferase involved in cell wall biosynthesis